MNLNKGKNYWVSKIFIFVFLLKVAASFLFASSYVTHYFAPFLSWFVTHYFQNPWDFFYSQDLTRMFPYPSLMLWLLSLPRLILAPLLPVDWHAVTPLHLFAVRVPVLISDVLLFQILLNFFPGQQKKLIAIYWCSPIIFFINYLHGQLDMIPTALFFAALYLLLRQRYFYFSFLLALAVATKNHLWIALPFIGVFLIKKQVGILKIAGCAALFLLIYVGLLAPYGSSMAFRQMVFYSPEQQYFFDFVISISGNLKLIVCPTVLALLFIKFASYKKLNQEILLMFLGIAFSALVIFVPPMPGWFMWSFPFLIYFYMHNKNYSRAPFIIYNAVYLIYFLFFFEKHGGWAAKFEAHAPIRDLALSIVTSSVGFISFWMFNLGVRKNEELKIAETPLLIGIGGDSSTGKHTLLRVLRSLVGKSRSIPIFGDDFHKWDRQNKNWSVYTHLNPSANRLHEHMSAAIALNEGREIEMGHYDHHTGRFSRPEPVQPNKFIFFVGLHPFYLKKMRDLIPIKIYLEPDENLRQHWKIRRDVARRGYSRDKVLAQISSREEDRKKFIEPQKEFSDLIIRYSAAEDIKRESPVPLKVTFILDNSVDMEILVLLLLQVPTLRVTHSTSVHKQELAVEGLLPARKVMEIAHQLNLNFDELLIKPGGWVKGYKGVTQLVFLLLYNEQMKAR